MKSPGTRLLGIGARGALLAALTAPALAQVVRTQHKIAQAQGGFTGRLQAKQLFGYDVETLGDLDGDGVGDLAVGARGVYQGGSPGAVWILFMTPQGTVRAQRRIGAGAGGFTGVLEASDGFGHDLACLGDLDGDGTVELAVGAPGDDDGGEDHGAVYILSLSPAGKVVSHQKIGSLSGGFTGKLTVDDSLGTGLGAIGDLDGDGVTELGVSALGTDEFRGAVWILFLNADRTVRAQRKISMNRGLFTGQLDPFDYFGNAVSGIGDLDLDGVPDIAVGAPLDDDGAAGAGAVWVLFLRADGRVRTHQKISLTQGGFGGALEFFDEFGNEVEPVGDLDRDGVVDLAVGARNDDDGGVNRGAVYLLYLRRDGTVKRELKISQTEGGFGGVLRDEDRLGTGIVPIGDLDGNGIVDLAVGASRDDDSALDAGALWILQLDLAAGPIAAVSPRNGSGANRVGFTSSTPPAVGSTWTASVDTGPAGPTAATLVAAFDLPASGSFLASGELLVAGNRLWTSSAAAVGGTAVHSLSLPLDPRLLGLALHAQAGVLGGTGLELLNALDLLVGGP